MQEFDKMFKANLIFPQKIINDIIRLINYSKNIAIIGHIEPDGDVIGAQLSLFFSLDQAGYIVDVINEGPFNNMFLKRNKKYFKKTIDKEYDLYIIIDTPSKERIGLNIKNIDFSKTIVIDHHPTNSNYGMINWVDENYVSTCEMILLLLFKMKIGLGDHEVCQHLLNGIISDNGYFQHIRKDKYFSLLASYFLIGNGADPRASYNLLFGKKNIVSKKLFALALDRLETVNDGSIIWSYINENDKKKFKNAIEDNAAVYKEMLSVKGVDISIFFKVKKDRVDISFRSNGKYDVSELAEKFGGGGHRAAAGASINGKFQDITNKVLQEASRICR